MSNWKYTDETNTVVYRTNAVGAMESCFASSISDWLSEGNIPEPADLPSIASIQDQIVTSVQLRLDTFARTRNYDSILSACTYATSQVPKFASEGQQCVDLRDATWSTLYSLLAEVQAGTKVMPSDYLEVEPLLPALQWST